MCIRDKICIAPVCRLTSEAPGELDKTTNIYTPQSLSMTSPDYLPALVPASYTTTRQHLISQGSVATVLRWNGQNCTIVHRNRPLQSQWQLCQMLTSFQNFCTVACATQYSFLQTAKLRLLHLVQQQYQGEVGKTTVICVISVHDVAHQALSKSVYVFTFYTSYLKSFGVCILQRKQQSNVSPIVISPFLLFV